MGASSNKKYINEKEKKVKPIPKRITKIIK